MADRNLAKWQIASLAIIILIIPVIIVFQLTKADIVIDFDNPNPFENKCFLGESQCTFTQTFPEIELREDDTYWWILGEDVYCVKTDRTVEVPVSDPVGVITEETEVSCNDLFMFDKTVWDFSDSETMGDTKLYVFTLKGI